MYNFIDTTETTEGSLLPSEALKINGEYIENLIDGYRTLNVSGREALSPELSYFETGIRDGATFNSKRFPPRIITVTYQLSASTNIAFRTAYNKLGEILNVEDAELIFNDEPDKFFIGTPETIEEVEPGINIVTSSFTILCLDPFKYSVTEYEAEPTTITETDDEGNITTGQGFVVNYNGTYKSYPTLEATFYNEEETDGETETELTGNGDCGFVAFFNDEAKIIQLGDPDEEEGEDLPKSQTLVNQSFTESTSWGTATKSLWAVNSGITPTTGTTQTGNVAVKPSFSGATTSQYYMKAGSYGTASTSWHGPSITRTLQADEAGVVGASDFTFTYKHKMCIGSGKNDTKQCGAFQCLLVNGTGDDRKIVAGVDIYKSSTGKKANLKFYINGKTVQTMTMDLSYNNKYFGANSDSKKITTSKTGIITKIGSTVNFNIGGIKKSFKDSEITDTVVNQITFTFTQYKTKTPLSYNGIYSAKFVKNNCATWRDIPNKFSAGDIVKAECKTGIIYLNDTQTPEYGALGNDWESFYLKPGSNQIGIAYSDWVISGYEPTFKMRYREVFI